jgi:predicted nucleotidyltransferase
MKISGIIAEYNPFHNGHQYQIEQTKQNGATHLVAVMSGNYVQRGDLAVFSKWARAKAALQNGIDLVIELPTPFSMSAASDFAYAGVYLLNQLGVQEISFGSESGNLALLKKGAQIAQKAEQSPMFQTFYQTGISYPKAIQKTAETLYSPQEAQILTSPNNLLAIEYIKAASVINPSLSFFTTKRVGSSHDSHHPHQTFSSASFLRSTLLQHGLYNIKNYVPDSAFSVYREEVEKQKAPVRLENIEDILCYRLRQMNPEDFSRIVGICEGMENRFYQISREKTSLSDLIRGLQTKRYTNARIRRILCACLLGIEKNQFSKVPAYLRVLASNQRGAEILKQAKNNSQIPIVSRFSQPYQNNFPQALFEGKATDLYSLASPQKLPCGRELTEPIFFLK